jgi:AcrR family transcriptional regulator
MVQILKDETTIKIFEAAQKEFLIHGFKGAKVRDIAKGAGIPVGLIYSYYESKETLFEKIVDPMYKRFEDLLTKDSHETNGNESRQDQTLFDELKQLLYIFRENREAFLILIDKSEGTKYENVKRDIISMMEAHIKTGLLTKVKDENKNIDNLFFHILAVNFIESIFEIGRHYKDEKWAEEMLNIIAQQYFYGVNSF